MSKFGELEAAVMDRLWTAGDGRLVRDVLTELQVDREIAYTTVMTVMERLFRKGMLTRVQQGKAFIYAPAMTRADYTANAMAAALAGTRDRDAALVHFADKMTAREASTLLAALASRAERRRGRR
ncbi:MAG: BlaI/MecI/CopY family transcriptional regulator [Actinobacteria bacterium]|nr:BlaI/MecI/CopY family transcriptional regulator [Actinomycetota bacterium]MCA1720158.1 BlaI/MecI/CopY family transcriptional regulator [Actinomycetota bacterium]